MRLAGYLPAFLGALAVSSCSGGVDAPTDYLQMIGDSSFQIVENCPPNVPCFPSCVNTGVDDVCGQSIPPSAGGCWITGGGYILNQNGSNDSYGGNGMPMKDGTIRGEWENVDHGTGDKSHGQVHYLVCRHVDEPGPGQPSGPSHNFNINQAYYGGPARWFTAGSTGGGWADGYWFDVFIEDHGEPGNKAGPGNHGSGGPDYYHFTIRKYVSDTVPGDVVFDTQAPVSGGNLQIHPPNNGHPSTPSLLPPWVGLQP
jgi:hypothetical protein